VRRSTWLEVAGYYEFTDSKPSRGLAVEIPYAAPVSLAVETFTRPVRKIPTKSVAAESPNFLGLKFISGRATPWTRSFLTVPFCFCQNVAPFHRSTFALSNLNTCHRCTWASLPAR
jgi:hypothetical protein